MQFWGRLVDNTCTLGRAGVVDGRAHDPCRGVSQGVNGGGEDECEEYDSSSRQRVCGGENTLWPGYGW